MAIARTATYPSCLTDPLQTTKEKHWGDIGQALKQGWAVSQLKSLDERKQHPKFWRPNILVLAQDMDMPLVTLASKLSPGGMCLVGTVLPSASVFADANGNCEESPPLEMEAAFKRLVPNRDGAVARTEAAWLWISAEARLNLFPVVAVGSRSTEVYANILSCAGLGAVRPNNVLVPFLEPGADLSKWALNGLHFAARAAHSKRLYERWGRRRGAFAPDSYNSTLAVADEAEYVTVLREVLAQSKNLLVARNLPSLYGKARATRFTPASVVWHRKNVAVLQ